MPPANSFPFDKSSVRSFMSFRNRTGPNVEPLRTHAVTWANEEACPLSTTFCALIIKKLYNKFKVLSDMPLCFSLKIMPSCHTLSTTLKIAIHLMIYDIFFIQKRTKRYDLYHLLLIYHMDILLDHIMLFSFVQIWYRHQTPTWIL